MAKSSLKVVKLVTNDEIIGVVRDGADEVSNDELYTLENLLFITNPMKVISEYDAKTKVHALYLSDWIPAISDNTLPIDKQRVVTLGSANKELEAHYIDIILAHKLLEEVYDTRTEGDDSDKKDLKDIDALELIEKLKKHKFDDDDMQ